MWSSTATHGSWPAMRSLSLSSCVPPALAGTVLPYPTPPHPLTSPPVQIIHVNLTSENPQPITSGKELAFTYSVQWQATAIPFARRFERYLDYNFFEHQVGAWWRRMSG